jgi:hypothetical protein
MQSIINKTKKIIDECNYHNSGNEIIRNCVNSIIDTVVKKSMKIVKKDPLNKSENKKLIKKLVKESLHKCKINSNSNKVIICIESEISNIIDLSVDIMTELL